MAALWDGKKKKPRRFLVAERGLCSHAPPAGRNTRMIYKNAIVAPCPRAFGKKEKYKARRDSCGGVGVRGSAPLFGEAERKH